MESRGDAAVAVGESRAREAGDAGAAADAEGSVL